MGLGKGALSAAAGWVETVEGLGRGGGRCGANGGRWVGGVAGGGVGRAAGLDGGDEVRHGAGE